MKPVVEVENLSKLFRLGGIGATSLRDSFERLTARMRRRKTTVSKLLMRALTAVIREVRPTIVLTHPPQDYMEDHTNTCRLV